MQGVALVLACLICAGCLILPHSAQPLPPQALRPSRSDHQEPPQPPAASPSDTLPVTLASPASPGDASADSDATEQSDLSGTLSNLGKVVADSDATEQSRLSGKLANPGKVFSVMAKFMPVAVKAPAAGPLSEALRMSPAAVPMSPSNVNALVEEQQIRAMEITDSEADAVEDLLRAKPQMQAGVSAPQDAGNVQLLFAALIVGIGAALLYSVKERLGVASGLTSGQNDSRHRVGPLYMSAADGGAELQHSLPNHDSALPEAASESWDPLGLGYVGALKLNMQRAEIEQGRVVASIIANRARMESTAKEQPLPSKVLETLKWEANLQAAISAIAIILVFSPVPAMASSAAIGHSSLRGRLAETAEDLLDFTLASDFFEAAWVAVLAAVLTGSIFAQPPESSKKQ